MSREAENTCPGSNFLKHAEIGSTISHRRYIDWENPLKDIESNIDIFREIDEIFDIGSLTDGEECDIVRRRTRRRGFEGRKARSEKKYS